MESVVKSVFFVWTISSSAEVSALYLGTVCSSVHSLNATHEADAQSYAAFRSGDFGGRSSKHSFRESQ